MISSSSATSNHNVVLEPTTEQSSCETVLERTIVEAFVKMIVCRQVTVQTISAKDGQVLESNTKLEEDQPVVLKVNKHEMTNYMSSSPFFSPAASARSSSSAQSSTASPSTARPAPQPPRTSQASSPHFPSVQKSPASLFLQPDNLVTSPELLHAMAHLPAGLGSSAQHSASPRNPGGHSLRHAATDEPGQVTPRSLSDRSSGQAGRGQHLVGKSQETAGGSSSSWHSTWQSSSSSPFNLNSDHRDPSPARKPSIRSGERPGTSLTSGLYLDPVEVPRPNPKETVSRSHLSSSSSDSGTSVQTTSPRCSQVTSSQVDSGGGVPVVVVKIEDDDDVPVTFPPCSSAFSCHDQSPRDGAGFARTPQQGSTPAVRQHLQSKFHHQQPGPEQVEYGANAWYSSPHTASTSAASVSEADYMVESDLMVMAETSGQPESLDLAPQALDSMMQGLQEGQAGYGGGETSTLGAPGQQPVELKMATGMEKTHFISPELVNRWTCRFCSRSLPSYGSLVSHMKTHNPNRPFQCTFCKKTFAQSCVLKTHIRTHTGEKPYVCSLCGKGFAQAGHLASHKKFHSGIRPFVCSVCSKRFIQKSDLVKHSKIHLRESLVAAGASTSGGLPPQ